MTLVKYNHGIMPMGVRRFLNDVFNDDFIPVNRRYSTDHQLPAMNVKETNKAFEMEMAVPGFDKKSINIDVEDDVLTISGEVGEVKNDEKERFTRKEFNARSFKRSFTLPESVLADKIDAKMENGVLMIEIPKAEVKESVKRLIKIS